MESVFIRHISVSFIWHIAYRIHYERYSAAIFGFLGSDIFLPESFISSYQQVANSDEGTDTQGHNIGADGENLNSEYVSL